MTVALLLRLEPVLPVFALRLSLLVPECISLLANCLLALGIKRFCYALLAHDRALHCGWLLLDDRLGRCMPSPAISTGRPRGVQQNYNEGRGAPDKAPFLHVEAQECAYEPHDLLQKSQDFEMFCASLC